MAVYVCRLLVTTGESLNEAARGTEKPEPQTHACTHAGPSKFNIATNPQGGDMDM